MAVAIDTSTNGTYGMFSSENATLAIALSEVLDELEQHNKALNQTQFVLTFDSTNSKYAFVAIVKNK